MLETALSAKYIPGSNMKGDVEGANWIFLLPNFEIENAFCVGLPDISTLMTLSRFSNHVVVCVNRKELDEFKKISHQNRFSNLCAVTAGSLDALPLKSNCTDLILVVDLKRSRDLNSEAMFGEFLRVLNPNGLIYFEFNKMDFLMPSRSNLDLKVETVSQRQLFWLTPFTGEAHTAVPMEDSKTRTYFLDNDLYTPSISLSRLKRMKRLIKKSETGSTLFLPESFSNGKNSSGVPRKLMYIVRSAMDGLEQGFQNIERSLIKHEQFVGRFGFLMGEGVSELAHHPPLFLRSIASSSGVDISNYRWGLSARGDYSSRKVLLYLFKHQNERPVDHKPEYIVKLVRDPIYNYRLENEYRTLSLLNGCDEKINQAIPNVVFWGYHNSLAILGETIIEGGPFRQKTNLTATCPFMRSAVNWLTELGVATVNKSAGHPEKVAEALENLFDRFIEIYSMPTEYQSFLTNQIETFKSSWSPFPLVFQHGDPGTWNALVTSEGRVAFLDWESAEPQGMPLWDLFYFLRSYNLGVARSKGIRNRIKGVSLQILSGTPFSRLFTESTIRYSDSIGLSRQLIEPLFYTCWMHRALKEATRRPLHKLESAHYVNLLRFFIKNRSNPVLSELFNQ